MRAFLSHSSKDKPFVSQVADALGPLQCEYDEYSFEFILNTEAIRKALRRSDLFVFFLSANSVKSSFVAEELRAALEDRARGLLKQVLIFSLDATSYQELPEWMRDINVVRRLSTPKACARKIQAALLRLAVDQGQSASTYLGRDEEEATLRKALAAPPGIAPVAIHAVGHFWDRQAYFSAELALEIVSAIFQRVHRHSAFSE